MSRSWGGRRLGSGRKPGTSVWNIEAALRSAPLAEQLVDAIYGSLESHVRSRFPHDWRAESLKPVRGQPIVLSAVGRMCDLAFRAEIDLMNTAPDPLQKLIVIWLQGLEAGKTAEYPETLLKEIASFVEAHPFGWNKVEG